MIEYIERRWRDVLLVIFGLHWIVCEFGKILELIAKS